MHCWCRYILKYFYLIVFVLILIVNKSDADNVKNNDKIRVCVVEGRGAYKRSLKFCPILESKTNIECVIGVDRLDCVRRIHKGSAHFGVFSSEDLIAARWASIEILVTNEMRFHDTPFEYEVVAVVDNESGIHSVNDLRGARLCHPGHGLENHWTEILANYFESVIVPKTCDQNISLTEDRIRASANFFGSSCKAGPWVQDPIQDRLLKSRYPTLCQMCYDSYRCGIGDKHWGRRGTLYCLTSGGGDVSWARLDDVYSHFGLSGTPAEAKPEEYSFLCPGGHLQPINTTHPCVWVAKPWPAIAARSSHAAKIQELVHNLTHDNTDSWQNALLSLLETYHVTITPLDNTIPINDYLEQAIGFQSAYSFPECNPPRSIVYCTTSILQHIKCSWLQEASQVYGISPNIQCIRSENLERCMDDTMYQVADVVLVDQDSRVQAQRDFKLEPILFEFSQEMHERYVTVAIIKRGSNYKTFHDLKGLKACLPSFEGASHLSVLETIANITHTNKPIINFFSKNSCIWDPAHGNKCPDKYRGDIGALECLIDGGDIAFISSDVFKNFTSGLLNSTWSHKVKQNDLEVLCPFGKNKINTRFEFCHLHWTLRGHLMMHTSSISRRNEVYNSLRDMDRLFGKQYKSHTTPFTMFGVFDKRNNVMFRDNTDGLRGLNDLIKDSSPRLLEDVYNRYSNNFYAIKNSSTKITNAVGQGIILLISLVLTLL